MYRDDGWILIGVLGFCCVLVESSCLVLNGQKKRGGRNQ